MSATAAPPQDPTARRRARHDFDCEDLLKMQAKGHELAISQLSQAHADAMAAADRAAERRDNTFRFLLAAALTILAGLVGISIWPAWPWAN